MQLEALNVFGCIDISAAMLPNASTVPTQFNVFQNETRSDKK
ncbi:hypothetical protein LMED105_10655 [Limnobacter sp. MED105]|nr:hypothetical protein LMED105_10655 [Limnobacter sp. MED105]